MDDFNIVNLYFARDEQAISETDKKYGKLCRQISNNILNCLEDSEECVNDTYLTTWNLIPPTRPNHFMPFLTKIVRNLSLKRVEFNNANKRSRNATVSFTELEEVLPATYMDEILDAKELGTLISTFLRSEKTISRCVFIRKYFFFDSVSSIAFRYSLSESKVKSMLFRTRTRLRKFLMKEGIAL